MITKGEIQKICFEEILGLWKGLPNSFPEFLTEVEEKQKQENEVFLEGMGKRWKKIGKAFPEDESEQREWKKQVDVLMEEFLEKEQILGIRKSMSQELFQDFEEETKEFVRQTRRFDSEISLENIWQALRNYFIYAVIADLQGQPQKCKEDIFSYSLLYPYTDNYIDEKEYSEEEKKAYNEMIQDVLCDRPVMVEKGIPEKTCRLLEQLLSGYEGEKRKEIQNLLLLMLEAQSNSIRQQSGKEKLSEEAILRISVYKGSISVLIDYFFTVPRMKKEEIYFYLKFGFLLQLADDLQDVKEDKKSGSQTLMGKRAEEETLEEAVNHLLHYTHKIFAEFTPINDGLKSFMEQHCYTMVVAAALANSEYFSKDYIRKLERFFPVHVEYMQKQQMMPEKIDERMRQRMDKYIECLP